MTRSTLVRYPGSSNGFHGFAPGVLTSRYPRLVNRTHLSPIRPAHGHASTHSMRTVVVGSSEGGLASAAVSLTSAIARHAIRVLGRQP